MFLLHFLLVFLFHLSTLSAHPTYIRLGYNSCTACHESSTGGGLLTDYGKGISASQSLYFKDLEEMQGSSQQAYHQAFQSRLMNVVRPGYNRFFPMQADYLASYHWNEKFGVKATLAVAPPNASESSSERSQTYQRIYFRELSAFWDFNKSTTKEDRLSFGSGFLPLGLGIVDHTSFVRSENRLTVTDIPIELTYFQNRKEYLWHTFIYTAHPLETKTNAESGLGGQYFQKWTPKFLVGGQWLLAKSPSIRREMGGFLVKYGVDKWAFLTEIDRTWRYVKQNDYNFGQWALYQQIAFFPKGWLSPSFTWQRLQREGVFDLKEDRFGFNLDWKVYTNLSFNSEIRYRKGQAFHETSYLTQAYLNWW